MMWALFALLALSAMAVVGLSWVLATVLGALPFYLAETYRDAGRRMTRLPCCR